MNNLYCIITADNLKDPKILVYDKKFIDKLMSSLKKEGHNPNLQILIDYHYHKKEITILRNQFHRVSELYNSCLTNFGDLVKKHDKR